MSMKPYVLGSKTNKQTPNLYIEKGCFMEVENRIIVPEFGKKCGEIISSLFPGCR